MSSAGEMGDRALASRPGRSAAVSASAFLSRLLLTLTLACVLVPFSPQMPAEGLDPSWMAAMNQATAQALDFGREVIFTFGPYASVYTRTYHPATDAMMMWGSLHVFIAYSLALIALVSGRRGVGLVVVAVAVGVMNPPRDALFFWYPLLVVLCADRLVGAPGSARAAEGAAGLWVLALLCSALGLLPLVKGSMLISCAAVVGLLGLQFIVERRWRAACVVAAVPLACMVIYWVLAGQSIDALPEYFRSILPIITGYTAAMSTAGHAAEPMAFALGASWLIAVLWVESGRRDLRRLVVLAIYAMSLFLAFKAGFVRHDGHALIAGSFLLLAALSLNLQYWSFRSGSVLLAAAIVWAMIDARYLGTTAISAVRSIQAAAASSWNGAVRRVSTGAAFDDDYAVSLAALREASRLRPLEGRADIYSYNQSLLLASGALWSPRPVFQSYSAYTPELADRNRLHLLSGAAPDSIAFRVEPIDGRVPASEDGASWPLLLSAYRPFAFERDVLYLRRRAGETSSSGVAEPVAGTDATMGAPVVVPGGPGLVFARITVKPTALGRIANLLYKPSELRMGVLLNDGRTRTFRFVAGSGPAGLVMSPLIENTTEFALLYDRKDYLDAKRVTSFWITAERPARFWSPRYTVAFERLDSGPRDDVRRLIEFDRFVTPDGAGRLEVAAGCEGNIDAVNGVTPGSIPHVANGLLSVAGWLAASIRPPTLTERVLLVLTDASGGRSFVQTRRVRRPDVGVHFAAEAMADAGFVSTVDVSEIRGHFDLGLAYEKEGVLRVCPQFTFPLVLRGAS